MDLVSSDTRRELLQIIKRRGSLSVDEAMEALDMARTTIREHLLHLKEQGLLERSLERQGRGRPSHRYAMSQRAQILFPSRDNELMGRLIQYLRDRGEWDLVDRFFEDYWSSRTQSVKHRLQEVDAQDLEETLTALRTVLREEGFMPTVERSGDCITIRECNCPFPETVKRTKIPCRLEREFFESIFGTALSRVSYIPEGSPACTYEVPVKTD